MDIKKGLVLDGFHVTVAVQQHEDGTFHLSFATMPEDSRDEAARRVWAAPQATPFASQDDANKHARYIMLGIRRVSASGKPDFTVL
jgi:hypothetical protein